MSPAPRLTAQLDAALQDVARIAGSARQDWWVIGSAAMALHGARLQVGDIDLLMSREDAALLLPGQGIAPSLGEPHPRFRSEVFGRCACGGFAVEVMAGFHVHDGADWRELVPSSRVPVRVGEATLFVPAVDELIWMCELFARPKDLERARLLRRL